VPRFANYIQDHMVLQRAPLRAVVWGFGDANTLTTLTMNDQIYTTISRSEPVNELGESIWSVTLDPVEDEGPFDIYVSQPLANGTLVTITLDDVLFGDVWICSGQSNMQLTVSLIYNATEEIANAGNYPKIRVFTATRKPSDSPVEELINISLNWSLASAHSIGGPDWEYMSAVCWLYGRMIHQALNGRPIGLIATSFGGTFIELWMPPKALQDCNTTTLVLNIFLLIIFFQFKIEVEIQQYNHMMNILHRHHLIIQLYLML
jgi:sialate O-acetylesterase